MKVIQDAVTLVRRALMSAAKNTSLFVFAAFLLSGVLDMTPLTWYKDQVTQFFRFILVPWGMALTLGQLLDRQNAPVRADTGILFVLLVWMTVPFIIRFGLTFNNLNAACGYAMVFFGIYAALRDASQARREQLLGGLCAVFGLFSLVFGGALLYCAATVQTFAAELGDFGFGVSREGFLCSGVHYNITGMVSVCCAMICLAGAERTRCVWARALYLIGAAMMMAVVVLTQSRTARYVLLLALALGVFCRVYAGLRKGKWLRAGAGILAAGVVLVAGYVGAAGLCDAALGHYMRVGAQRAAQTVGVQAESGGVTDALADLLPVNAALAEENAPAPQEKKLEARPAMDASFSARTRIWASLFEVWKENPKALVIGNGVGRTGSQVYQKMSRGEVGGVAVHNTYLQFIADYGLIGFVLMLAFFLLILRRCVRAFFRAGAERSGMLPLAMLVAAILITGMMESAPLGEMTPMNVMLFFALGMLVPIGERGETATLVRDAGM